MSNQLTQKTVLESGLTALTGYVSDQATPYYHIAVKIGSGAADDITNGEAHFLEHMAFNGVHKGGKPVDFETLRQEREDQGIIIGAYTTSVETEYSAQVPVNLGMEGVKYALAELSRMVCSPTLPEERINHEKRVISNEWGSRFQRLQVYLYEQAYIKGFRSNAAFGHRVLGEKETVADITREGLVDFMAAHYSAPNTDIAVSGPVDHAEIVDLVKANFADMPTHDRPPLPNETGLEESFDPEVMDFVPHNFFRILLSWPGHDTTTSFAALALTECMIQKRLNDNIREKVGSTYGIGVDATRFRNTGYFSVYSDCAPNEVDGLIRDISKQIWGLTSQDISRDLRTLQVMICNAHAGNTSNAENMVANLSSAQFNRGELYDIEETVAAYSAVTPTDIQNTVLEMLDGSINLVGLGRKGSFPSQDDFQAIMRLQDRPQPRTLGAQFNP